LPKVSSSYELDNFVYQSENTKLLFFMVF